MKLENRITLERKIVARTIHVLLEAGFQIRVHDGEDFATARTDDKATIWKAMFSTDEEQLRVYKGEGTKPVGYVYFVYGNDGEDVIHDYTTNLEEVLAPVFKFIVKQYRSKHDYKYQIKNT